jgi:hypothetical protein
MKDLTGDKFGRYTVLEFSHRKGNNYYWKCRCDCGNERLVNAGGLNNGSSTSCGCYNHEVITKHGLDGNKLYHVLNAMKNRCTSPKNKGYMNYGGRGITLCEEWMNDPDAFIRWANENGYKDGLTIERVNVNGNYCPENCRWVDRKEQANNTRTNLFIEYNGETRTLSQWAEHIGIKMNTLYQRIVIAGWPIEKAMITPTRHW